MSAVDGARIRAAIDAAEAGSTGRIAVRIIPQKTENALETAERELGRAGLHKHQHRNAIIFLVAPKSRKFAVYGDKAIHERVGATFWRDVVDEMTPYFAREEMTGGLIAGIERAGEQLRAHFPKAHA